MICQKCGCYLSENAKACSNCGEPVTQQVSSLGSGNAIAGDVNVKVSPTGKENGMGLNLGERNAFAGDIHQTSNVVNNNHTINNVVNNVIDERLKIVSCHICGKHLANDNVHNCPSCGKFVCSDHFDSQKNLCASCLGSVHENAVKEYQQLLIEVYADGKITAEERASLEAAQKRLGISLEEAAALEKVHHRQNLNLTVSEKVDMEDAAALLLQNQVNDAYLKISKIYNNHPKEEVVLNLYLRILKCYDPDEAIKLINSLNVDFREVYLTAIDIYLQRGQLDEAERKINLAKQIWPSDLLINCAEVRHLCALAYRTKRISLLNNVNNIFNSMPQPENSYENGAFECAKAMFDVASGSNLSAVEELKITAYWREIAKALFALSPEERERLERERLEKEEQERKQREQEAKEASDREFEERARAIQLRREKLQKEQREQEMRDRLQKQSEQLAQETALLRQRVATNASITGGNKSSKNKMVALILALFLGYFGADRFYLGHTGMGLLKLFTFGGFGIMWLVDFFMILSGSLKPSDGDYAD